MQLSITNIVLSVSRCCSMCGCCTRQPHGGSHVLHWSGCFYLTACKPVCVHVSVFVCVPQTRCDCPWMLSDFFFFSYLDLTELSASLCSLHVLSDPHEFPEGCLWDPDRGWGGRCCKDPVRHLCQPLHLPGPSGWGHATGSHWQVPQQPAASSVGFVCVCVCDNLRIIEMTPTLLLHLAISRCRQWQVTLFHMHHE